jgi:glycosidase
MSDPVQVPSWVPGAVFYQVFPERFCNGDPANDPPGVRPWDELPTRENFFGGDLAGVIQKLDYLQDTGVSALYLTPIFRARTNHKYDTADYCQVDPAFGTNADLKRLVSECHRRGMRIILDGVFNHCGIEFFAFQDLRQNGAASPYADWFHVQSYPIREDPLSYMTCGGAVYLPKLNYGCRAVREYFLQVARYWIEEAGIDGWRLDVPFKIPMDFWHEFRQVVKQANPEAYLVGEVWREAYPWVQGDSFDGVTNYRLRDLLLDYVANRVLDGEDFAWEVAQLRRQYGPTAGAMLNLLGSHDTPRILTLLREDRALLRIALVFLLTGPGAPLIYYGDEVGMTGGPDPDCRRPMVWQPDEQGQETRALVQRLTALRREHACLREGATETLLTFNGVWAYRQRAGEDEVILVLNPQESVYDMSLPVGGAARGWKELFSGAQFIVQGGLIHLDRILAKTAWILVPDGRAG